MESTVLLLQSTVKKCCCYDAAEEGHAQETDAELRASHENNVRPGECLQVQRVPAFSGRGGCCRAQCCCFGAQSSRGQGHRRSARADQV